MNKPRPWQRTTWWSALGIIALGSCAGSTEAVKPDEMSAANHHQEAQREAAKAREEARLYRPGVTLPVPSADPFGPHDLTVVPVYNPSEAHLQQAEQHREHARQHERAAQFLERFEETECRAFPPSSRAACPLLGPVVRIDDIPDGVRVTFKEGVDVDDVIAHMRCHFAYARARGFEVAAGCPLYVRGIDIRRALDPMAVEIVSADKKVAAEVRARSREEAVVVRQ
jgi:hypothetical protein